MKTNNVPAFSFLAVIAAFAVLPLSLPAATAALAVVGLCWIMSMDYAARPLPFSRDAGIVRFANSPAASFGIRQAA